MEFSDLSRLASAHVEARIIQAALQAGIFDALKSGTRTADAVAASLDTDRRATELLLNALTALRILEKQGTAFALGAIARKYLVKDSPQYFGGMVQFDASLWEAWGRLGEALRSGKPVRPPDMFQGDARETRLFVEAMDSLVRARGDAEIVTSILDWKNVREMLDIGSGPATYPIHFCRRVPHLQVTVFDLPGTIELTATFVEAAGLSQRIRLIAGDYRTDSIPGRYDLIFLSNIIHGESYEENERLMTKISANLTPTGRIVVKDHILSEDRTSPAVGAIFSVLMLLSTREGRCYSFGEVKNWMVAAGMRRVEKIDLPSPLTSSLVTAAR